MVFLFGQGARENLFSLSMKFPTAAILSTHRLPITATLTVLLQVVRSQLLKSLSLTAMPFHQVFKIIHLDFDQSLH
jgi:hypothetical protein